MTAFTKSTITCILCLTIAFQVPHIKTMEHDKETSTERALNKRRLEAEYVAFLEFCEYMDMVDKAFSAARERRDRRHNREPRIHLPFPDLRPTRETCFSNWFMPTIRDDYEVVVRLQPPNINQMQQIGSSTFIDIAAMLTEIHRHRTPRPQALIRDR